MCGLSFFLILFTYLHLFFPFCCSPCLAQVREIRHEVFKTLATVIKCTAEKRAIRAADSGSDKHLQVQSVREDCVEKTGEGEHLSAVKTWQ